MTKRTNRKKKVYQTKSNENFEKKSKELIDDIVWQTKILEVLNVNVQCINVAIPEKDKENALEFIGVAKVCCDILVESLGFSQQDLTEQIKKYHKRMIKHAETMFKK